MSCFRNYFFLKDKSDSMEFTTQLSLKMDIMIKKKEKRNILKEKNQFKKHIIIVYLLRNHLFFHFWTWIPFFCSFCSIVLIYINSNVTNELYGIEIIYVCRCYFKLCSVWTSFESAQSYRTQRNYHSYRFSYMHSLENHHCT